MDHRQLGRSGLWLSEIGLGNLLASSGGDPALARASVRAAFDEGVTTFQAVAADGGGDGEEALGDALAGLPRDDLVLSAGVVWPTGAAPASSSRKRVAATLHGALTRLRTDHLDVLVLPRFDHRTPLEETFGALADLVRQGKLHYAAVTEWTAEQIAASAPVAAHCGVPLVADQVHYSMLWRVAESQVMPAAGRAGLGLMAYAPLAQGLLTGKYAGGAVPTGSRAARARGAGGVRHLLHDDLLERVVALQEVAVAAGCTPAQLALAWVLQNASVSTVFVGASDPDQVRENCAATGLELDLDTLTRVDSLLGSAIQSDPRLVVAPTPLR